MADNAPPTKKSRLQEWVHAKSLKYGSKIAGRPRTPLQQVTGTPAQSAARSHLHLSNLRPSFLEQHGGHSGGQGQPVPTGHPLSAYPLSALVSPTTATAAAFRNLAVDDSHAANSNISQDPPHQIQVRATGISQKLALPPSTSNTDAAQQSPHYVLRRQQPTGHALRSILPTSQLISLSTSHRVITAASQPSTSTIQNQPVIFYQIPLPYSSGTSESQYVKQDISPQSQPLKVIPNRIHPPQGPHVEPENVIHAPQLVPENYKPEHAPTHSGTGLSGQTLAYKTADRPHADTPPNLYTSRQYLQYQNLPLSGNEPQQPPRKRKFSDLNSCNVLAPPAHVYERTNNPAFNIFDGLLLYPELCYQLALHIPLHDLISIYAISKDFHTILDTRFTTMIISLANHLTPTAAGVFPFRCYAHLCRLDPAARIPHPDPKLAAKGLVRKIPSFKWVKMLLYREKVIHEILAIAAQRGVPMPRRCGEVLMKFWFMMDIPRNTERIGYIHNVNMFTDLDLYFGMCIMVKLDMLFNDPIGTEKRDGGRRMTMSQRSLTTLLLVLKGEIWTTKLEVLREWVRWKYEPSARDITDCKHTGIFGVPLVECGRLKHQYWGRESKLAAIREKAETEGRGVLWLLRPDQMIVREAVRRGLRFKGHVLKCLLYGYVDPRTLGDLDFDSEGRDVGRREKGLDGHWEYDFDGLVGNACSVAVEDGGDPYLDLGKKAIATRRCKKEEMSAQEKDWRDGERAFMRQCYGWWKGELAAEGMTEGDIIEWEEE